MTGDAQFRGPVHEQHPIPDLKVGRQVRVRDARGLAVTLGKGLAGMARAEAERRPGGKRDRFAAQRPEADLRAR